MLIAERTSVSPHGRFSNKINEGVTMISQDAQFIAQWSLESTSAIHALDAMKYFLMTQPEPSQKTQERPVAERMEKLSGSLTQPAATKHE